MIVSANELIAYLRAGEADRGLIESLELAAIDTVQDYTGTYHGPLAEITTGELRPRGSMILLPDEPADGAVTLERWNGSAWEAVGASEFRVDGGVLWVNASYNPGTGRVPYRATYEAGYVADGVSDSLPAPEGIKQAIRMLVAHWFDNREAVAVGTISTEIEAGLLMLIRAKRRTVV